ncbi:class I SAM-dependent methyltransferase [Staphylococcus saccharolyticus]|nr:class I SAM-dependent methyltransferase [Staphylococcus saccharolyticus]
MISESAILKVWQTLELNWNPKVMPTSVIKYFKSHFEHIAGILTGKTSANLLLFEHGNNTIADDLYQNTAIARFINEQIEKYINHLTENESLSILELGAGTGATTLKIVDRLGKSYKGEYIFTDISHYFIVSAKERFQQYPFMKYSIVDIDHTYEKSLISNKKFDVIIAVGVMNNSQDIKCLLNQLHQKLTEKGKLLIGEAYGESSVILMTQAFMMKEPKDVRKLKSMTFLNLEDWYNIFEETGFKLLRKDPFQIDELAQFKQALFILEKR